MADEQPKPEVPVNQEKSGQSTEQSSNKVKAKGPDPEVVGFDKFGLSKTLLTKLNDLGITIPRLVQLESIPPILAGQHALVVAPPAEGKTLVFALPMIQKWLEDPFGVFGLILTPTRELGLQIKEQMEMLSNCKIVVIVGRMDFRSQAEEMYRKPAFIIATPGRFAEHVTSDFGFMKQIMKNLRFVVFDEADKMFGGDFDDDLQRLASALPDKKQILLFSATADAGLVAAIPEKDPFVFTQDHEYGAKKRVIQEFVSCPQDFKDGYLIQLLREIWDNGNSKTVRSAIIFAPTVRECKVLQLLISQYIPDVVAFHSGIDQKSRTQALSDFRSGLVKMMVATDLAGRGLNISLVDLVIHYSVPMAPDYVHRIGRAGRSGREGWSILLITPRDIPYLIQVEEAVGFKVENKKVSESKVSEIMKEVMAARNSAETVIDEDERKAAELKRSPDDDDDSDKAKRKRIWYSHSDR